MTFLNCIEIKVAYCHLLALVCAYTSVKLGAFINAMNIFLTRNKL